MQISTRMAKLLEIGLSSDNFSSVQSVADALGISRRTIFREIKNIESLLKHYDLTLTSKQGSGIKLEGSEPNKDALRLYLKAHSHGFMDRKERQQLLILEILKQKQLQKLFYYADKLKVSEATISNDLSCVEKWFVDHDLKIQRTPGIGIELIGEEEAYRKALTAILYEDLQDQVVNTTANSGAYLNDIFFKNKDNGILKLLDQTILQRIINVFTEHRKGLSLFKYAQSSYIGLMIHLTVAIDRILKNEEIKGNPRIMDLVSNDNAFEQASQIARLLEKEFEISIPEGEIAFIAMHLKGAKLRTVEDFDDLSQEDSKQRMSIITLIYRMIDVFDSKDEYHLKRDDEFIQGLYAHLRPTLVRLEHQLPIHNPLLDQLKEMYTSIYEKTLPIKDIFETTFGIELPEAEVGFIAMHFGAAMERLKHNAGSHRVVGIGVICSSGIGTSSLLSARIKSIFKSKVEVIALSISQLETMEDKVDLLVSTFYISQVRKPFMIVSPLLGKEDVIALEHLVATVPISRKSMSERKGTDFLRQLKELQLVTTCMIEVCSNFCIVSVDSCISKQDLIEFVGFRIGKSRDSGMQIRNDIMVREELASTYFADYHFLLLHAQSTGVDDIQFQVYAPQEGNFLSDDLKGIRYVVVMLVPEHSNKAVRSVMSLLSRSIVEDNMYRLALEERDEIAIKSCMERLLQNYLEEYLYER